MRAAERSTRSSGMRPSRTRSAKYRGKVLSVGTIDMSTDVELIDISTASSSERATLWYAWRFLISAQSVTRTPRKPRRSRSSVCSSASDATTGTSLSSWYPSITVSAPASIAFANGGTK